MTNENNELLLEKINIIKNCLKDFVINDYKILNYGVNSIAILVNNEYVFRFPLTQHAIDNYTKEQKILNVLNKYIKSTKIPITEIYNLDKTIFTKHKIIKGVEYLNVKNIDKESKERISKQIATFYFELHSINRKELDFISESQFDPNDFITLNDKEKLYNILKGDFQNDLEEKIDFLLNYNNFPDEDNVLNHNDLHEENILIFNNNLSGIIDFSDVVFRKRDSDFSNLFEYDPELAFLTIKEYEKLINKKIDLKYSLYIQKIKCYSFLLWCYDTNSDKYFNIVKNYVKNLNNISLD